MPTKPNPDAALYRRCRQGDAAAWRALVRRFTPQVYRLAVRMLGDQAEAEDVSQEVFMRIHRSFEGFDPTRPLAPWISRITYNTCLKRLGRASARLSEPVEPDVLDRLPGADGVNPEQRVQHREAGALFARAFDKLSAQDRALMVLYYREGLSLAEAAEATGLPVTTIKTRLFRARARVRQQLAPTLKELQS